MPSGLDNAEATRLVNAMLGLGTYTAPTLPIVVRLMTSMGTATANGTELAGNVRQPFVAASGSPSPNTATNGEITNSVAQIILAGLSAGTVRGVELWDSAPTPRRKMAGTLAAEKVVAAGDSLVFATSALTTRLGLYS